MNPEKRSLIQVKIDDLSGADKRVSILMGDQVAPRREWIEENVDFEISDDFDLEIGVE
jgi:topoisomerase-4 subunit B